MSSAKSLGLQEVGYIPGVGKLFKRRARFGKTVDAAGRTLIGKQGENLFFFFFFRDHGPRTNVISKIIDFHLVFLVFLFHFCIVETYFFENHCHPHL